jgi:hypothetical protein
MRFHVATCERLLDALCTCIRPRSFPHEVVVPSAPMTIRPALELQEPLRVACLEVRPTSNRPVVVLSGSVNGPSLSGN